MRILSVPGNGDQIHPGQGGERPEFPRELVAVHLRRPTSRAATSGGRRVAISSPVGPSYAVSTEHPTKRSASVTRSATSRLFVAGLSNFFTLFMPVADSWKMFDNSGIGGPRLIAGQKPGAARVVYDDAAWRRPEEAGR